MNIAIGAHCNKCSSPIERQNESGLFNRKTKRSSALKWNILNQWRRLFVMGVWSTMSGGKDELKLMPIGGWGGHSWSCLDNQHVMDTRTPSLKLTEVALTSLKQISAQFSVMDEPSFECFPSIVHELTDTWEPLMWGRWDNIHTLYC